MNGCPPGAVACRTSYWPIATYVRYGACGRTLRQFHRTNPGTCCCLLTSTPFEIASTPGGTAIDTSNVALSRGWSLLGYHHGAICGSFTPSAPVIVRCQPPKPYRRYGSGVSLY